MYATGNSHDSCREPGLKYAERMKRTTSAKDPTDVSGATEKSGVEEAQWQLRGGEFPIVGMGASAGGLEALENFFKHVPPSSGLAFVIVQHLDPTHTSVLDELLQRCTTMKVSQVEDLTQVQPDHVYVIPPNFDMYLLHNILHLVKIKVTPVRGLQLPINSFFRSLAEELRDRSIGIVLSGMGTDGTLGLKAIKEQAGIVLVQDPETAKFDGMPRSAVNSGLADIVASAEELPARLLALLQHTPVLVSPVSTAQDDSRSDLDKLIMLLRRQVGHDFSMYKRNTLHRRIERRMGLHQILKIKDYVQFLGENPQELELLFKELLIGVTSFFRDSSVWDQLSNEILPTLLKKQSASRALRAWVAGCSTGEEAYSLAIVFKESLDNLKDLGKFSVQIFATDLNRDSVRIARQGFFADASMAEVSPERLGRFFIKEEKGYRVTHEIRAMITFAPQNLISDPTFCNLDILCCRNLLIYFTQELQNKILTLFHYSLKPGAVLFLGNAESVGGFTDLFVHEGGSSRFFWRKETARNTHAIHFPSATSAHKSDQVKATPTPVNTPPNLQTLAEQWVLQHRTPASVLVNDQGDILFIIGRTGRYLEPAAGKVNWNALVMAREGLREPLTTAFQKVCHQKQSAILRRLKVTENRLNYFVDVGIEFIHDPGALLGLLMIMFTEVPGSRSLSKSQSGKAEPSNDRVRELEQEVQRSHEELEKTLEEHQTSREELKSINEEMQSANEELQSLNEELTTSKEELQSLNEELQTVNAELQAKANESYAANNDMRNLLDSTEIATVFLDNSLNVRRFTESANKVIKLIPTDVGRPITDLVTNLIYPDFESDVRNVLRTLVSIDKSLVTHDGQYFATRLMPYRTIDNRIDGVVITFTDLSRAMKIAAEARSQLVDTEKGIVK